MISNEQANYAEKIISTFETARGFAKVQLYHDEASLHEYFMSLVENPGDFLSWEGFQRNSTPLAS